MPPFETEIKQLKGLGETGKQMQSREAALQSQPEFQIPVVSALSARAVTASGWPPLCQQVMGKHVLPLQELIYCRKCLFAALLQKSSSN